MTWWSSYAIGTSGSYGIVVSGGVATVYCVDGTTQIDCSPFQGEYVYINGNSNPNLDGVWLTCPKPIGCTTAMTVQFNAPSNVPANTYYGGNLFSPNYWPIALPFATQDGATSVELWECDIDYAFNTVTFFVGSPNGCNSTVGLVGPNLDYQHAITNTQAGLPSGTSEGTGKGILSGKATRF